MVGSKILVRERVVATSVKKITREKCPENLNAPASVFTTPGKSRPRATKNQTLTVSRRMQFGNTFMSIL